MGAAYGYLGSDVAYIKVTVMPQGVKLGKTMHEINTMAVVVMANIMESCDFERLKESYESVQN